MFGIIGAFIYGLVYGGAWLYDDSTERKARDNSQKDGCEFYFDKHGRMRHTSTGKRYSTAEVHEKFFKHKNDKIEEIKKKKEQIEERSKNKYFGVKIYNGSRYEIHVFDKEIEAKRFCVESKKRGDNVELRFKMISDAMLDDKGLQFIDRYIIHFNRKDNNSLLNDERII